MLGLLGTLAVPAAAQSEPVWAGTVYDIDHSDPDDLGHRFRKDIRGKGRVLYPAHELYPRSFVHASVTYKVDLIAVGTSGHVEFDNTFTEVTALASAGLKLFLEGETYDFDDDDSKEVSFTDQDVQAVWAGKYSSRLCLGASDAACPNSTGRPVVTGSLRVGDTLTAATGAIADADGLTAATFAYQWLRIGAGETEIPSATTASYTPTAADAGFRLRVRVTFTDDGGGAESVTSARTAAVLGEPLWQAALTIGIVGNFRGYDENDGDPIGDLDPVTMTLDGTDYTVELLRFGTGNRWRLAESGAPDQDGAWLSVGPHAEAVDEIVGRTTKLETNSALSADDFETRLAVGSEWAVCLRDPSEGVCPAAPETAVGNFAQGPATIQAYDVPVREVAQAFATGPNPDGYALVDVRLAFQRMEFSTTAVHLYPEDAGGDPDEDAKVVLAAPSDLASTTNTRVFEEYVFTAPPETDLDPETTYFVGVQLGQAEEMDAVYIVPDTEDAAAYLPGWSIADKYRTGTDTPRVWTEKDGALRMRVRAAPLGVGIRGAPEFDEGSVSRRVPENSAGGVAIGAPLPEATDPDGDTVTYSLTGERANDFALDPSTRQLRTKAGVDYDFEMLALRVVLLDAADGKDGSNTLIVNVQLDDVDEQSARPDAPELEAIDGSSTTLQATWQRPGRAGGPAIEGYEVQYRVAPAGDWQEFDHDDDAAATTLTGLLPGTEYQARVRALNGETPSDWSEPSDAEPTNAPPGAPLNLTATAAGSTAIALVWDSSTSIDLAGFRIEVSNDAGVDWTVLVHSTGTTDTTYLHAGLPPGATRHYRVAAIGEHGTSAPSNVAGASAELAEMEVPSDWTLKPAALGVGDAFRVLFVSKGVRNARPTRIVDYNAFVQAAAAAGHHDIRGYSSGMRAVGSTRADGSKPAEHARDSTGTLYTADDKGVPIYWLDGNRLADDYEDFYDGSWDDEVNATDESGEDRPFGSGTLANRPFTGSDHDGTADTQGTTQGTQPRGLGSSTVRTARQNDNRSGEGPIGGTATASRDDERPFYGLSSVLRISSAVARPRLSVADAEGPEGGAATFTVTLAEAVAGTATVDLVVTFESADTADLRDLEGVTRVELTISAGDTEDTFKALLANDNIAEPDETFTVRLENPSSNVALAANPTATGTIIDGGDAGAAITATEPVDVGVELTVDTDSIGDAHATPNFTYQWRRLAGGDAYGDGTDLATTQTYTPVAADRGHMLVVRVSYTDQDDSAATMDTPPKAVPLEHAAWSAVLTVGEQSSGELPGLGYSAFHGDPYGSLDERTIDYEGVGFRVHFLRFGTSSNDWAFGNANVVDPQETHRNRMAALHELRIGAHGVEIAASDDGLAPYCALGVPCVVNRLQLESSDPIDNWEAGKFWPLYLVEVPRVSIAARYDEAISGIDQLTYDVARKGPGGDADLTVEFKLEQDADHVEGLFLTDDALTFDSGVNQATVSTLGYWSDPPTADGHVTVRVKDLVGYNAGFEAVKDSDRARVDMRYAEHPYDVRIDEEAYEFLETAGTTTVVALRARTAEGLPMPRTPHQVSLSAASGTAASPGDFAVLAEMAEIRPSAFSQSGMRWEAHVPVEFVVVDDHVVEDEESFELLLQRSPGQPEAVRITDYQWEACATKCEITATIVDDDVRGIAVTPSVLQVVEEAFNIYTYGVVLTSEPTATTTVTVAAPADSGLTVVPETLEFGPALPDWSDPKLVRVAAAGDDNSVSETYTVTFTAAGGDYGDNNVVKTATVTVVDNDLPQLAVSDPAAVAEGGAVSFDVTLSTGAAAPVTVDYAVSGNTATAGDDFEADSGTLTFAAGDTTETVTVTTRNDLLDEEDEETFTLTLSNASSNAALADPTATATITDDDDPPQVRVADATAAEGGAVSFDVTLSAPSGRAVTVDWATSVAAGDTAVDGVDFTAATSTLMFAPEQRTRTVEVATTADADGDDETFTLTLSMPTNATFAGGATTLTATGTIADTPRLDVADVTVDEGGTARFEVTLSRAAPAAVTVDWALSDGTATVGVDFDAGSGTLTFAPGDTAMPVTVTTTSDDLDEGDAETFTLTLSNASSNVVLEGGGATQTASGTITDDDDPPVLSVDDVTVGEGDPAVFAVELSARSGLPVTVDWATTVESGDSAEADDLTPDSGTLTFTPGATRRTVTAATTLDADNEDETFTLTLSELSNATFDGGGATLRVTGTIADLPRLSVAPGAATSAWEGDPVEIRFRLTRDAPSQVSVDWTAAAGPGDTVEVAEDLPQTSGRLVIAAGREQGTLTVPTNPDGDEADETFTVTLSNPANATFAGGGAALTVPAKIADADRLAPIVTVDDVLPVESSRGGSVSDLQFRLLCPDCPTAREATQSNSDPVTGVWFDLVARPNERLRVWQEPEDEAAGCAPIVDIPAGEIFAKATQLANFGHPDDPDRWSPRVLSLLVETDEPCNGRVNSYAFAAARYTLELAPWNRSLRAGPAWVVDTRGGVDEFKIVSRPDDPGDGDDPGDTGGTATGGADTGGADTGGADTGGADTGGADTGGTSGGTGGGTSGTSGGTGGGTSGGGSGGGAANRPPVVEREIDDQTLEVGEVLELDIRLNFYDRDQRALDYSVESADASVATVSVDRNALLTIRGVKRGVTAVTVTAADRRDERASDTFAVTVRGPALVALVPRAADPVREGFVRVINHDAEAGEVSIEAVDDTGVRRGPVALSVDAGATVHFNSGDLEDGNAEKGLPEGVGPGEGDWRLVLDSDLDFEVLAYVRTQDGFLTSMHDLAPLRDGRYRVAIFNPGSNPNQVSRLRLVNPGSEAAEVTITGVDDAGASPGTSVEFEIPAGESLTLTASDLEAGVGVAGALGDGVGKWRLRVTATGPLVAMSLLSSPTGHLTNLSTVPRTPDDEHGVHVAPLFPSASDPLGRQGFVRVVNRAEASGTVSIEAFDDSDLSYPPVTLALDARQTRHFNSDDLELGNAEKGLAGSTGPGVGDWRLVLSSDLDIEVLAYIRAADGFLTSMHDVAPGLEGVHRVVIFNPGSNPNQVSGLRLVNPGSEDAEVTITGIDDNGASHGGAVTVTVPAGASRTIEAADLEAGADGFAGALGDGVGKWRLAVTSAQPVIVMSLLSSPTGHLTNLSTAPDRGGN